MATIYSYPRVENLTGDDVLLLSDSTEEQRTLSVSIGQVADYVSGFIQLGNNPSAIDFVSELQDYMSIEDNVLTIGGYATAGSVDTISSGLAELKIETQANLNGAISQIELRVQTDYQSYVNGKLASYSDTVAMQGLVSESTADLASAESFTILQSELGTFDEDGRLLSLSESFANNVLSTSNTENLARASDVTNLTSRIFDTETGLLSESFANSVMSTENTTDYATSQSVTNLSSTVSTKPNIFKQNDIPATDEPAGSLWYNTSEGNKLYMLVEGPPKEWQETDDSRIGPLVDSSATATQTLQTHTTDIGNNSTFATNLAGSFGGYDAEGNITNLSESFANSVMERESATNYADAQKLTELGAIVSTKPNVYRQDDTPSIYSDSTSEQVIPDASIWYDTNDNNKVYIVDEDPSNVGVRIWTLTDDSRIGATASKITSMSAKFGSFDTNNNFSISGSSDYLDTVITTVDADSATASKVSNLGAELGAFDSDNNFNTSLSADFKTAVNNEVDANSATAGYVNNLSAAVGIDKLDGTPQSQATALVNGGAGAPVTATLDGAVSGTKQLVLTAANSDIEVGQYVTYSTQDSTINRDLRWRVEAIEQENIFLDNEIYLENETTVSFTGNTSITVDNVSGTIREGFQIKGAGITPGTFVSVVDGNNITLSLAENLADDTELEFLGIYAAVKETASVVARVDGTLESTYGLQVDANGNVAGMKLLANNEGSEVSFLADSFKIYNDSSSTAPFEVVDGVVKIKQGAIGTVTFGDLSDVPASFTTTVIYAEDTVGTNASTTKGTLTHVAFYNGEWSNGDSVEGITFDKIAGTDGTSVNIIGPVDTVNDLPTSGVTNGDGYLVDGNLYVWDGSTWVNAGNIQGPQGIPGAGAKTVKLSPSKHVISYSTVYNEENEELTDVENDTITFNATPQNIEGTAEYEFYVGDDKKQDLDSSSTFELTEDDEPSSGESVVVKVKLYDNNTLVAEDSVSIYGIKDGYNPVKGRDYDDGIAGNNVIVEYSTDGNTPWVTTQAAGVTYRFIRTGVQTNGEGDFVYGPATKFVPEFGVEYNDGDPGVSSYLHIKYSNDGVNFTLPDGEDVGDYIGTYVDSTEADSTTFSDYTWKKILGESALTSFLTNATHAISADSDGNVTGEYSEAGGAFKVLLGTTDITSQCEFAKIEENGVGVTIDNNSDNDTPNGVYIISQMTADSGTAIFQATVPNTLANTDEDVILTQTYSISKSKAGTNGADAKVVKLNPSKHVINYSTAGAETDTIIFNAVGQNVEGTATYRYYINNEPQGLSLSTTSTFELPDDDEPASGESIVVKVELHDDDVLVATDEVSIYGVKDGSDAPTAFLTNAAHVVSASANGTVSSPSYTDAGGTFKVFVGNTDVTTSCTFEVDSQNEITASIDSSGVYTISDLQANNGFAVFKATIPAATANAASDVILTAEYSISKSIAGADGPKGPSGADGIDGTDGAYVSFIYKVSDTQPEAPTSGSYNGTTETIPAEWTDDPTASVDDTEWVSSVRYYNAKTFDSNGDLLTSTWGKGAWSTPAIYYQRGAEGINGLPGLDGANGRRTAKGVVFYQSGKATDPTQLSSSSYAFDFNEGSFINLHSHWGTETPEMAAGTASNQYWSSSYYVTENEVHHLSDPIDWYRGNGASVSYASGEPGVYTISRTIAAQDPYIATSGVQGNSATYWKDSGTVSVWARGSGRLRLRLQEHGSDYTPYEDLEVTLTNTFVKYSLTGVNVNDGNNPQITLTLLEGDEVDIYNPLLIADNSGVGRVVFQPPVRAFAFNQVVTFSALEASGSTEINGGNIKTGIISSKNYQHTTTPTQGFSDKGMAVNLDNGSIHAERFFINADGTAKFNGIHEAGKLGNWVVTNNALKSGYNNPSIVLDPTGNYPESGYGEITIAATNLPSITPLSYADVRFEHTGRGLTGRVASSSTIENVNGQDFIVFNDIVQYAEAKTYDNNTVYNTTGSSVEYSLPGFVPENRGGLNLRMPLNMVVDYDYAASAGAIHDDDGCRPVHDEIDYTVNVSCKYTLTAEITFTITNDNGPTSEKLVEQVLADRYIDKAHGSTLSLDNGGISAEQKWGGCWFDFTYEDASAGFYEGPAAPIKGRLDNLAINSKIKITRFRLKHEWKDLAVQGDREVRVFCNLDENRGWFSSALTTWMKPVLWKEDSGTNKRVVLAENGLQVRSNDGYAAIGDVTAGTNVAEFWGDIQIAGNAASTTVSTLAVSSFSDKRLKDNISAIESPVDLVGKLNPVKYDWKSNLSSRRDLSVKLEDKYGFLAQEVEEVIPTAILQNKNKIHGIENPLSVEYNNIIAINTAAIKELITKINELEKEIESLKQ